MALREVFRLFSRRSSQTGNEKPLRPLTPGFRNRLIMNCAQRFAPDAMTGMGLVPDFWEDVHTKLRYHVGRPQLTDSAQVSSRFQDIADFLVSCPDKHVLDFVECIFLTDAVFRFHEEELVDDINQFFRVDDLPYEVTSSVWAEREPSSRGFPPGGSRIRVSLPQVIRRDDEVTHQWAVGPALSLLRDKSFTSANTEFLKALVDFRNGDYDDCLAKCGSAFESTMKIICDRKGWPYDQKDTADPLIRKMLEHSTNLEAFFHQPLLLIGTIRNRLSSSHGSGVQAQRSRRTWRNMRLMPRAPQSSCLSRRAGSEDRERDAIPRDQRSPSPADCVLFSAGRVRSGLKQQLCLLAFHQNSFGPR
jgi:hypothetical protein